MDQRSKPIVFERRVIEGKSQRRTRRQGESEWSNWIDDPAPATVPLDQAAMDRAGVEAIRQSKISDLIFILAHSGGRTKGEITAIMAEIDRRIPVPDPRIGKLCRLPEFTDPVRVVGAGPSGSLNARGDDWAADVPDLRVDPILIAPGDWLDG